MEAAAVAAKDPESEWGRLVRESSQLADYDLNAPWSNALLKDVIDATIFDPQTGLPPAVRALGDCRRGGRRTRLVPAGATAVRTA